MLAKIMHAILAFPVHIVSMQLIVGFAQFTVSCKAVNSTVSASNNYVIQHRNLKDIPCITESFGGIVVGS